MEDVEAIVRKAEQLDGRQRHAVLSCDRARPAYALASDYNGSAAVWAIRRSGLFDKIPVRGSQCWHYALNETGQSVRTYLLSQTKE